MKKNRCKLETLQADIFVAKIEALQKFGQMKKGDLIVRFEKRISDISRFLTKTREGQGITEIHELRLAVKKAKALFVLIERTAGNEYLTVDHFRLIATLFKQSGLVREAQVNLRIISRFRNAELLPYKEFLKNRLHQLTIELMVETELVDDAKFRLMSDHLVNEMSSDLEQNIFDFALDFVIVKLQQALDCADDVNGQPQLHKIRIYIRKALTVLFVLRIPEEQQELIELLDVLNAFNKQIGRWHDYVVLIASLREYTEQHSPTESQYLARLILKLERRNMKWENEIISSLKKNLNRERIDPFQKMH